MESAIVFAATGHLCLGTLHANSANQTIDRIVNFFPEERRKQLLMDLSGNLRAIVSQRLIRTADGNGRKPAVEILINTPIVADKLLKGEFNELKPIMAKSGELGMRTFDGALFDLYNEGHVDYEEAIRNADSANELRLNIKLNGSRAAAGTGDARNARPAAAVKPASSASGAAEDSAEPAEVEAAAVTELSL
jgi:twitching motility protein PilU